METCARRGPALMKLGIHLGGEGGVVRWWWWCGDGGGGSDRHRDAV